MDNKTFTPHHEPEEIFLPLEEHKYAHFYSTEMDEFSEDIHFYRRSLYPGSSVLELGCGTGRISNALADTNTVTALDLSMSMLQQARQAGRNKVAYICMDMCRMGFNTSFENIIIPYNTINLLQTETRISSCLQQVYSILKQRGSLFMQIHIPLEDRQKKTAKKTFQFQIFQLPDSGGKLIKESIRSYDIKRELIILEERYRVRPPAGHGPKEDFRHAMELAWFSLPAWQNIIINSGFDIISMSGNYIFKPFDKQNDTSLLIHARK